MVGHWIWLVNLLMICQKVYLQSDPLAWELWPQPEFSKLNNETVQVHPSLYRLIFDEAPDRIRPILHKMTKISLRNIRTECGAGSTSKMESAKTHLIIHMTVKSADIRLRWEMSEQYTLDIILNGYKLQVFIAADTVYGARHALETLSQLSTVVQENYDRNCSVYLPSKANIKDIPAYSHRGLLLDTARNYFQMNTIKRILDGMAASKMNVFHWHITDAESFPLESARVPGLAKSGAFNPLQVYTKENVEDIVKYAQERGIRVMIEIDGPAHVNAGWKRTVTNDTNKFSQLTYYGNIKENNNKELVLNCSRNNGQFNVANPYIYSILGKIYRDITEYLPKPALLHMGGNEVSEQCWSSNAEIKHYMKQNGFDTKTQHGIFQLLSHYHNKALKVWDEQCENAGYKKKQPVMVWSSNLTDPNHIELYLDPNRFVIELLDSENEAPELLRLGYRVVLAHLNSLCLSYETLSWHQFYSYRLRSHNNMLGGEVIMWTNNINETKSGSFYLDWYIWPRAAAFAERLWSDPKINSDDVVRRLDRHRRRLEARGLGPGSLAPSVFMPL